MPYMQSHEEHMHAIDLGVDQDISLALEPGHSMSDVSEGNGSEHALLNTAIMNTIAVDEERESCTKLGAQEAMTTQSTLQCQQLGGHWAPSSSCSERLGSPRPAVGQCALLGGGKRGLDFTSDEVLDAAHASGEEQLTPGLLQDRLVVLQQRAMEAIQALPAECRDDMGFGKVETRVWGLEALKHVLRMRLAFHSNLPLTRLVDSEPEVPPANELLAANLTLSIGNKGNRCYANTVLRMWCWIGAHHSSPKEFWGPSTKLCLQTPDSATRCH